MLKKTRQFIINHWVLIAIILFIIYLVYSGQSLTFWQNLTGTIIVILKWAFFGLVLVTIGGIIVYIIGKIKEAIEETKKAKETKEDREKRALSQKAITDDSVLFRIMRDLADKNDKTEV